jgi:hypothetical protein
VKIYQILVGSPSSKSGARRRSYAPRSFTWLARTSNGLRKDTSLPTEKAPCETLKKKKANDELLFRGTFECARSHARWPETGFPRPDQSSHEERALQNVQEHDCVVTHRPRGTSIVLIVHADYHTTVPYGTNKSLNHNNETQTQQFLLGSDTVRTITLCSRIPSRKIYVCSICIIFYLAFYVYRNELAKPQQLFLQTWTRTFST